MSSKINRVLQKWPTRTVATLRWLRSEGVDRPLAEKYVQSGWLERFGHGAYMRAGSSADWPGGVYALQTQLGLSVHLGAITAAVLRGYGHYLALRGREVVLFGTPGTKLPSWFKNRQWSQPIMLVTSSVLEKSKACTSIREVEGIRLAVADLELAAFEMMYLAPKRQSYEEALQIMESLAAIRPQAVQQLLESCTSIKTKRLFMHAAEQVGHRWLSDLDLSNVDFGSGRRTIHVGGKLNYKYNLVIAEPVQS